MIYSSLILNGLKAKFLIELTLMDLFNIKKQEKINEIVFNTKLFFEGKDIKSKIRMILLLILLKRDNKLEGDGYKTILNLVNDIFLSVTNGNYFYKIKNKDMFSNYENFINKINNCLDNLRKFLFDTVNTLKEPTFKVFQNLDFNKIKIGIFGSPKFKVGVLGITFQSPKNNEFIDKVLKNEIKYEEKEDVVQNINEINYFWKDQNIKSIWDD